MTIPSFPQRRGTPQTYKGKEVVRFKKTDDVEVHIDGMGDPGAYPQLVELVEGAKAIRGVAVVSMQTRLYMLDEGKIRRLAEAGLDRFNVSIDPLDLRLVGVAAGLPRPLRPESHGEAGRGGGGQGAGWRAHHVVHVADGPGAAEVFGEDQRG
jgi:hypothetical protein